MLFVIWIASIAVATVIGLNRGSPIGGFLLGLFLGPIGILAALALENKRTKCPFCRERIDKNATKCPRCQSELATEPKL